MKTNEIIIWNSDLRYDKDAMEDWWWEIVMPKITIADVARKLGFEFINANDEELKALETLLPIYKKNAKPNIDKWYEHVNEWREEEKKCIDKKIDGTILRFGDCNEWSGQYNSLDSVGNNVADILSIVSTWDEHIKFYMDDKNVCARYGNHNGINTYIYRIAKDENVVKDLQEKMKSGELTKLYFTIHTESVRPYVAKAYRCA